MGWRSDVTMLFLPSGHLDPQCNQEEEGGEAETKKFREATNQRA
jgi:hypothetical protein